MPSKNPDVYLRQIVEYIEEIRRYIDGLNLQNFENDSMRQCAVTFRLLCISEASRRLPDSVIDKHPEIPWARVRGAGNIYRHGYAEISPGMVWKTITCDLDQLYEAAHKVLKG